jgi:hypothetical protein
MTAATTLLVVEVWTAKGNDLHSIFTEPEPVEFVVNGIRSYLNLDCCSHVERFVRSRGGQLVRLS